MSYKKCSSCQVEQPMSAFCSNKSRPDGLNQHCRGCTSIKYTLRKINDPGFANRQYLMSTHGITPSEYQARKDSQGGLCGICMEPFGDDPRNCHLDHDHTTGQHRRFLCRLCNTGLGKFRDNPELLEAAATYLRSFKGEL